MSPSSSPTTVPSVHVSVNDVDGSNTELTVGASAGAGIIFIGMHMRLLVRFHHVKFFLSFCSRSDILRLLLCQERKKEASLCVRC